MGKEISLIAFLDEVVSRNTQHYRKDFELDAQKLRDALNSPYMDERIFYFMSRPNGTWCVLERDVFLRDSDGYKIWTHYADMPDGIEAYRVTITGRRGTAPIIGHGGGATMQHSYCTDISWQDARPGDLVFYPDNSHVGIICGRDETGNLLVIHCASGANNVVITGTSGFVSVARPEYYGE